MPKHERRLTVEGLSFSVADVEVTARGSSTVVATGARETRSRKSRGELTRPVA